MIMIILNLIIILILKLMIIIIMHKKFKKKTIETGVVELIFPLLFLSKEELHCMQPEPWMFYPSKSFLIENDLDTAPMSTASP